jgi:hypothetical protein
MVQAMMRSAVTLLFQSSATGALLVMPHPERSATPGHPGFARVRESEVIVPSDMMAIGDPHCWRNPIDAPKA